MAIHPEEWKEFCDAFSQINKGDLMSVKHFHLDGRHDYVVEEQPLQAMTLDTDDACSDMISLVFFKEGQRRISHVVIEPIHLRTKEDAEGRKFIQIEAENGVTIISFHSGKLPEQQFHSEFASFGERKEVNSGIAPS